MLRYSKTKISTWYLKRRNFSVFFYKNNLLINIGDRKGMKGSNPVEEETLVNHENCLTCMMVINWPM